MKLLIAFAMLVAIVAAGQVPRLTNRMLHNLGQTVHAQTMTQAEAAKQFYASRAAVVETRATQAVCEQKATCDACLQEAGCVWALYMVCIFRRAPR